MISDLANEIIASIFITLGIAVYGYRKNLRLLIKSQILLRKKKVRISFAALLVLERGGRYLLIRKNIRRPEQFGLVGGAYKFYDTAKSDLDEMGFKPEPLFDESMKNDLRGFVEGKNLLNLVKWFNTEKDRETSECIIRILIEEMKAININIPNLNTNPISLRLIKKIQESPFKIEVKGHYQFRILKFYEISDSYNYKKEIIDFLFAQTDFNSNIILVSENEIMNGRTMNKSLISAPTIFLFSNKKLLTEGLPYQ